MDRCRHIFPPLYVQRPFPGFEGQPEAKLNPVKPELNVIIASHYCVPLSADHEVWRKARDEISSPRKGEESAGQTAIDGIPRGDGEWT
ncbi:hypothetical protein G5I_09541 [Acromyrmex echinatior]|uniref:Uncharacterized protein n=1 Tax=Acromyrmex echinatior TaxID=103372 RepID=F4WUH1_ACREC|nr:hypothetical protein G5I_09541 [Acromyrmex echinatior]